MLSYGFRLLEDKSQDTVFNHDLIKTLLGSIKHRLKIDSPYIFYRKYFGDRAKKLHDIIVPPSPFFYRTTRRIVGRHPFDVDL